MKKREVSYKNKENVDGGIVRAIGLAGGQIALARLLGVSQPTIHYYLYNQNSLPPHSAILLEKELEIPRSLLRPDLWG